MRARRKAGAGACGWVEWEGTKEGEGGRTVVGVALLVGRELQQQLLGRRSREVLATQRQPRRQPRDERRRARAWIWARIGVRVTAGAVHWFERGLGAAG